MTKKRLRLCSVVLSFVLLFCSFAFLSCNEKNNNTEEESSAPKGRIQEKIFDYGDKPFTIYIGSTGRESEDLFVEEDESKKNDTMYQAIRSRNLAMSEKYGVEIRVCGHDDVDSASSEIINSINAGDHRFQAICTQARDTAKIALSGYLYNLCDIESLQLDAPWWDKQVIEQGTIGDKLYWLVGDFSTTDKTAVHAIAFDKQLMEKWSDRIGNINLYDEVRNGTWTFEKMYALASVVNQDLDGNGTMDENDLFGLCHSQTVCYGYLESSGISLAKCYNEKPYIRDTFWSERTADVFEKWSEMIKEDWTFNWYNQFNMEDMFQNHQILFYLTFVDRLTNLRAAADGFEFGILPYPKFDEQQENYISATSSWAMNFLSLPIDCPDPELYGKILDAFSEESTNTVKTAYYDITLIGKTTRDLESEEMLDLIFATRSYDIGDIFDFGGMENMFVVMTLQDNTNIASSYAGRKKSIAKQIEKTLKKYDEVDS